MNRSVTQAFVGMGMGVLALAVAAGGCAEKKRTEIVVGLATDLQAPLPLKSVHLEVTDLPNGETIGTEDFEISGTLDNVYELPGTYAIYSASGTADRVRVRLDALDNMSATLVVRTAVLNLIPERTLFVRLGVISACEGMTDCGMGMTCVEGRCTSEAIDSAGLPDYKPGIEQQIACAGGTVFSDTSTKQPLTMTAFACATGTCLEGVCLAPSPSDAGADGAGADGGTGGTAGADGGAPARPATLAATYSFNNTFSADQSGVPALSPVDPMLTSAFQPEPELGSKRTIWAFNGDDATPDGGQAGLTLLPGDLVNPESYSVDMVVELTMRDGAWRRLIDVQNRQSDDGFYVDPSNNLDIYPVSGSTGAFTTNAYHHVVVTVDGGAGVATVDAYLDGFPQFASPTAEMDLDFDPLNNPGMLMGFFLDNDAGGGQAEWSPGKVALIRVWDGVLSSDQVRALAANPFAVPTFGR